MKKNIKTGKQMAVYQTKNGAIELKKDMAKETLWASQSQIAEIFNSERSVITKHIRNIFRDKELDINSVCAKIAHTAPDGKNYQVQAYNLDVILAVGYRTNSAKAIIFRQWATKILRQHIVKGYTINSGRIKSNYAEFQKALGNIKKLLPPDARVDAESAVELISAFADTWLSLEAYDKDEMIKIGATKKAVALTGEKLNAALIDFKIELARKGEAGDLFGAERQKDSVGGIVGNIMQSFSGRPVYPSIEEKAAHLLYFMVKNHPFVDGNKRSGAYSFIWFLQKAGILNRTKISPPALTALTLLVAESNPKNKERMIELILQLLKK
ncbi:MAG: virulence protein RhuM/Fic/DOC family protein [Patescibacteria group bacterium]|nr:virulence protein RhuM/Fic/DOC family protein [Patescibacteria group bacterium]